MFDPLFGPLKIVLSYISGYWWTVAPFLLGSGTYWGWINYKKQKYLSSIEWVLLEIKPPPDVAKSPKIAENIFSGLHSTYITSKTWKARFFKGEVQNWFSFEIASSGSETRFYVRTPKDFRNLVENLIFSQYPQAEIKEVEDYITTLPQYLPNEEYDLFGTELVFTKPDVFPLKTYPEFEEEGSAKEIENKRTDPLAPLAEQISTLEPREHIWIQLTLRGTGGDWVKAGQAEVDKILGKEVKVEPDLATKAAQGLFDLLGSILPRGDVEDKKEERKERKDITPGQKFVLDSVERKMSKLGFKAGFRFIYIGRKESFHRSHVSGVVGMFKQFYANDRNSFKPSSETITYSKGWFAWIFPSDKGFGASRDELNRKWRLYQNYRDRAFVKKWVILNTEELATLWHLPGAGIKAPLFPRVEAKKSQPPSGLPMKG